MRHTLPMIAIALHLANPSLGLAQERWWDKDVAAALATAGDNRAELEKALNGAPMDQRVGIAFLVANMPESDLKSIKADLLLSNLELAYRARAEMPWSKRVPEKLFLNDVLPYASVTETREAWRQEMIDLCRPIVAECKTITEAAQALNANVFTKLKVRYSTSRGRADQSPSESIKSGIASCTGLSILLVDACRSVGIPARVVGIPKWTNKPGNHTWVEIWDGDWHFTGACEFTREGLDRTWFAGDAGQANADSIENSIYASSFKRTATRFPLPWIDKNRSEVYAENVTDRYAVPKKAGSVTRIIVRVWGPGKRERISAAVRITDSANASWTRNGVSKNEAVDTNDTLVFEAPRNKSFQLQVGDDESTRREVATGDRESVLVDIELKTLPDSKTPALSKDQRAEIEKAVKSYFESDEKIDSKYDKLLTAHEPEIRRIAWQAYADATRHSDLKADFEKKQVRYDQHTSPYSVKFVGKKPAGGWPLFIAMHGGGGAPPAVNISQWEIMKSYYKDQDSIGGYAYVALRAPNDVWNGFYDLYCLPLVTNLIRQFTMFGDVDADKVFLMGYSHGGYGAFYIGPKMPDRFAAIHSSAAAQTAGTISAKNLRNTRFTFMIGEKDEAYGRRKLCEQFAAEIAELRKQNPGNYPVEMEFKEGFGHGGLPDRDKIKDMYSFKRNPVPKRVTWEPTDSQQRDFFWVSIDAPKARQFVDAAVKGNTIDVTTKNIDQLSLWLDRRLIDGNRPIEATVNGKSTRLNSVPSLTRLCESIDRRGDPELAATIRIDLRCD